MKALLAAASVLLAAVVTNAAPCLPGSLQSYIDLGAVGCSAGSVQFANFAPAPGLTGATVIDPSEVQVTPGGPAFTPNLQFILGEAAGPGELLDLLFRFEVSGSGLSGGSLSLAGATATTDGAVTGIENLCIGGSFSGSEPSGCPGLSDALAAFAIDGFSQLSDSRQFPASSFFDVFVNLTVDGGLTGTATLESATVNFNAVPEPSTFIFVLTALGFAALGRKSASGGRNVSK
jgi:hypothetical protein